MAHIARRLAEPRRGVLPSGVEPSGERVARELESLVALAADHLGFVQCCKRRRVEAELPSGPPAVLPTGDAQPIAHDTPSNVYGDGAARGGLAHRSASGLDRDRHGPSAVGTHVALV